jgi:glycerol uptake facilitator protein
MCYGEYFPSPGMLAAGDDPFTGDAYARWQSMGSEPAAFLAELLGTAILGFVVVAVTDAGNSAGPGRMAGAMIGLTVTALICVIAPLTQACFNPARDLGPRLFAYLAGWGDVAIPGPNARGMVTVYIVAPIAGAVAGVGLYQLIFRRATAD